MTVPTGACLATIGRRGAALTGAVGPCPWTTIGAMPAADCLLLVVAFAAKPLDFDDAVAVVAGRPGHRARCG